MIRYADTCDAAIIAGFQVKMAYETENLKLDPDMVMEGVMGVFTDSARGFYLISEFEQKVVGCLMITKEWSDWRAKNVWWIQSLYVLPEFRNKKIFSRMYDFLKEQVLNDDTIAGIRLYVDKSNLKAREVYKAIGMDGEHYQLFEWMKT